MPNKYYLRSDRTAVQPDPNVFPPYSLKYGTPVDGPDRRYWHENNIKWEQHIKSLPALDVDPDYLKRLSTGWFEGEEQYRITSTKGWVKTHKAMYDRFPDIQKQILIVAPQEAENCNHPQNIKVGDYCPACDNDQTKQLIPATPQPVTGEAETKPPFPDKMTFQQMFDTLFSRDFMSEEEFETICKAAEMYANGCLKQAASRPSDAVEFAEWANNYYTWVDGNKWDGDDDDTFTTAQLYELFQSKSPNPNK